MSNFRKLVEEIKPVVYTLLTPEMQQLLEKHISEIEIDPSELESAVWDSNPYDVEPQLALGSGDWNYNEDEYFNAQCEKMLEYIKADGAVQYLWDLVSEDKQDDSEYDEALTKEAEQFIENLERNI